MMSKSRFCVVQDMWKMGVWKMCRCQHGDLYIQIAYYALEK